MTGSGGLGNLTWSAPTWNLARTHCGVKSLGSTLMARRLAEAKATARVSCLAARVMTEAAMVPRRCPLRSRTMTTAPTQLPSFVTAKCTGTASLKNFLTTTTASVVCAQETKVTAAAADQFKEWCARNGWKCVLSHAVRTDKGGLSAGIAVLARQALGLGVPEDGPAPSLGGRLAVAVFEMPEVPPMCCASVYSFSGCRTTACNRELWQSVGSI